MNGTTLSGRYELIERVGGGGMALVYKAKDTLLNRFVAVKVLREQYVHDEEFIRRFRREAQSAASLSHPNVVNVYDVGEDGDLHFIVMEYIEGSNLNDIIKERAPLQATEAVHIATQICDALSHAHSSGIIHRDIKPHNILIGKNGRVKVTDFGIARAITSSTITQTGSVIGSVHYFSPEHAKGVSAGEQSDLYSLGIVLYQMLTGKLPFLGESPVSVALKHLQDPVEEPRSVNPMIPQSVENIILKAMRKRPEERYATAAEMLNDLETCLSPERVHEAKRTFGGGDELDEEATRVMPAIRPETITQASSAAPEQREKFKEISTEAPVWRDGNYEDGEEEPERNPWIKPLVWFGILLILIGAAWFGVNKLKEVLIIQDVEVIDVRNKPLDEARAALEELGFVVEEPVFEFNRDVPESYVISQSPVNQKAKEGSSVQLTVSKGIQMFDMPDLVGLTEQEAKKMLTDMGVPEADISINPENSDKPPGEVIEQFPDEGMEIDPLSGIIFRLHVSQGPEEIPMPNLIGLTPTEAQAVLEREGLELLEENIIHEKAFFEAGKVYKQFPYDPEAMVKPPGEGITIYVSEGLPDDAAVTTYTVEIGPLHEGQESVIRILVTDAMGDRNEVVNQKITSVQSFPFQVVTSPNKNAIIEVFQDDNKHDQITWTHTQAQQSGGSAYRPAPGGGGEAEPVTGEPISGDLVWEGLTPIEPSGGIPAPNESEDAGQGE